jgi:YD repeat-containing protein
MRIAHPQIFAAAILLLPFSPAALAQTYDYDAAGRLIRVAYPEGGGVAYRYDASDNMTAVMPLSIPASPAGLEVTQLSPTSVQLKWTPDSASSSYRIESRAGTPITGR